MQIMQRPIDAGGAGKDAVNYKRRNTLRRGALGLGVVAAVTLTGACDSAGPMGSSSIVNVGPLAKATVPEGIQAEANSLVQVPGDASLPKREGVYVSDPVGNKDVLTVIEKKGLGGRITVFTRGYPYSGTVRASELVPFNDNPTIGVIPLPRAEAYIPAIPENPLDNRPTVGARANVVFINDQGYGDATPAKYLGQGVGNNVGLDFYALPTQNYGVKDQDAALGAAVVTPQGKAEGIVVSEQNLAQRQADQLTGVSVTTGQMEQYFPIVGVVPVTVDTTRYTFNPKNSNK